MITMMDGQYKSIIVIRLVFIVLIIVAGVALAPRSFATDNGIVVLGASLDENLNTISNCVENIIKETHTQQGIIPAQHFRDSLFPFFEPSTAPKTVQDLSSLLEKPAVRKRIDNLEVRHVISIAVNTSYGEYDGLISCGINFGGGCFGYSSSDVTTDLAAVIWDLENPENSQTTDATASGKNVLIALILALPIITDTEGKACKEIAQHIVTFLKGGE